MGVQGGCFSKKNRLENDRGNMNRDTIKCFVMFEK
jgi:hypothetical protein